MSEELHEEEKGFWKWSLFKERARNKKSAGYLPWKSQQGFLARLLLYFTWFTNTVSRQMTEIVLVVLGLES